jgi:hypothetical protein
MKSARQPAQHRCDRCGIASPVRQVSPFEFEWRCPCGDAGVTSWAHHNPPPLFDAPPMPRRQQELFP